MVCKQKHHKVYVLIMKYSVSSIGMWLKISYIRCRYESIRRPLLPHIADTSSSSLGKQRCKDDVQASTAIKPEAEINVLASEGRPTIILKANDEHSNRRQLMPHLMERRLY